MVKNKNWFDDASALATVKPATARVVRFTDTRGSVLASSHPEAAARKVYLEHQRLAAEQLRSQRIEAMIEGVEPLRNFLSLQVLEEPK